MNHVSKYALFVGQRVVGLATTLNSTIPGVLHVEIPEKLYRELVKSPKAQRNLQLLYSSDGNVTTTLRSQEILEHIDAQYTQFTLTQSGAVWEISTNGDSCTVFDPSFPLIPTISVTTKDTLVTEVDLLHTGLISGSLAVVASLSLNPVSVKWSKITGVVRTTKLTSAISIKVHPTIEHQAFTGAVVYDQEYPLIGLQLVSPNDTLTEESCVLLQSAEVSLLVDNVECTQPTFITGVV